MNWVRVAGCAVLLAGVAACGNLPRPFQDRPGALAQRLAVPPVARLAVITPEFPGNDKGKVWAGDLADALVDNAMPARVGAPTVVDWSVLPSISRSAGEVTPHYELHDGTGKLRGVIDGPPVPEYAWGMGDEGVLKQSAVEAAPKIGDMLTNIEAARMEADPNSLMNRAARVLVVDGKGAPGDGDRALPDALKLFLKTKGMITTRDASGADYTVGVQVQVTDAGGGQQQVQIVWIVTDAQGREAGRVAQLNDVPEHSLDGHWGEVAEAAAEEAAGGVAEVMSNRLPAAKKGAAAQAG